MAKKKRMINGEVPVNEVRQVGEGARGDLPPALRATFPAAAEVAGYGPVASIGTYREVVAGRGVEDAAPYGCKTICASIICGGVWSPRPTEK